MLYFVVYLISCACLFVSQVYWPEESTSFIFLILAIFVLFAQVKIAFKDLPARPYSLLLVIPLVLVAIIVPFPFKTGFLLLLSGLVLAVLFPSIKYLAKFSFSLGITGTVLVAISIADPLFNTIASRYHDFGILNFFVNPLLKLLGLNSVWDAGNLYIRSQPGVEWILTTTEKAGLYFSLVFFIGSSIVILIYRQQKRLKTILKLLALLCVYMVLRYVFVAVLFLNSGDDSIFWNRWIEVITFLPLVFILTKLVPLPSFKKVVIIRFERFKPEKKHIITIIYIALFVFFASALLLFHDPGKLKEGRVLLDEKHSDWEWTEEKLDTTWYGKKALYNYYCLADYIAHYYHFERNFETITEEKLENYDILIIKTPTSPYTEDEIEVIRKFVFGGGGLLLIGDHTNVFGTSTFINPVAERFGLRFNYDATYEFKTGSLSYYEPPAFYSHPVVQSVPLFLFGTSCSIDAPLFAENVITGYGLKAVYLDYSKKNFFSTQNESAFMKHGLFLQCAGIKHGKGRVLAFSDSTVFSNFWMFMPGKPELFSGFLNWLNRINTIFSLKFILVIACLLLLWLIKKQFRKSTRFQNIYLLTLTCGIVFTLSYLLFSFVKFSSYALPEPHTSYYRICFDNEYSDIDMPISALTKDYYKSYNSLYISLQRLGYFPNISNSLNESLKHNDLVITINNQKEFPPGQVKKISSFLERGGKLLILEEHPDTNSISNRLLDMLGIEYILDSSENPVSLREIIAENPEAENSSGETISKDKAESEKSFPGFSAYKFGDGELFVIHNSGSYNDIKMGIANAIPNNDQLKNYRLVYDMIEYIVGRD